MERGGGVLPKQAPTFGVCTLKAFYHLLPVAVHTYMHMHTSTYMYM